MTLQPTAENEIPSQMPPGGLQFVKIQGKKPYAFALIKSRQRVEQSSSAHHRILTPCPDLG